MITYRTATRTEIDLILNWAAAEGWNPGRDDATPFYTADPNGFFVADHNGAPVAAISVVNHTDDFAFLGLYIVPPDFRGKGIGFGLWQHALTHAGDRVVGLDGVVEQQSNYAKSGFDMASRTIRYTGSVAPESDASIRPVKPDRIAELIAAEAVASGVTKGAFLHEWFAQTDQRVTVHCANSGAFCTIRDCETGAKIGPLFAKTTTDARRLMAHAATIYGPDLTIDVPATSQQLKSVCDGFSMVAGFETVRMYRGRFDHVPPDLFAAATLELG